MGKKKGLPSPPDYLKYKNANLRPLPSNSKTKSAIICENLRFNDSKSRSLFHLITISRSLH